MTVHVSGFILPCYPVLAADNRYGYHDSIYCCATVDQGQAVRNETLRGDHGVTMSDLRKTHSNDQFSVKDRLRIPLKHEIFGETPQCYHDYVNLFDHQRY